MQAAVEAMPKIELHRHLEGALRLTTLVEIARDYQFDLPAYDIETMRRYVQMMPGDERSSEVFLSKFNMLRQFYRTEAIITRVAREVVADVAADNVRYMELRFTPKALCNITNTPLEDVVPLVCDAANAAAAEYGIKVRYIISMNRHEPVDLGEHVVRAALDNRKRGVVGLDLAGDEANFSCMPFIGLFKEAKQEGLGVTIHAGEWAGVRSVRDAVNNMDADRLGHGIHALQDEAMLKTVIERGIALEVCPSSNVLSGVVESMSDHPITELTRRGALTTINTDDPLICNITLSGEISRIMDEMSVALADIKQYILRAANATFLPDDERRALVAEFEEALAQD